MKLKITVKESQKLEEKEIKWQDLPKGTVYKNKEGVTLVRGGEGIILLCGAAGEPWLEERTGREIKPWHSPVEILGQLTEIIVEKQQ